MAPSQEALDLRSATMIFNRYHRFQRRLSGFCEAVTSFSALL